MDSKGKVELPESRSFMLRFVNGVFRTLEAPGDWIKEKIVKPNQKHYPYYHEKKRRVPTIDQCYDDDVVCKFEADMQFLRDKNVDSHILSILRQRFEDCVLYEGPDYKKCLPLHDVYKAAEVNWFIKYGDLGVISKAEECYLKQKHRLAWEQKYGKVGGGMAGNSPAATTAEA